ncbi:hypothetical protein CF319_g4468 [Tilletia indica]|nr:hypothetical protein CF319_g4468 [Tilletia indica]
MPEGSLRIPRQRLHATGLPPRVQEELNELEAALNNCGRMTDTLSRLDDVVGLFKHIIKRNEQDLDGIVEDTTAGLDDIRTFLRRRVNVLESSMESELERSQRAFDLVQIQAYQELEATQERNRERFVEVRNQAKITFDEVRSKTEEEMDRFLERCYGADLVRQRSELTKYARMALERDYAAYPQLIPVPRDADTGPPRRRR